MKNKKFKFYLNTNTFYKWTRCLNCEGKTKVRKFQLIVKAKSQREDIGELLIPINKSCKFCPYCELIIAQDVELREELLEMKLEQKNDEGKCEVIGTIERKNLKKISKGEFIKEEKIEFIILFKKILEFDIQQAGWYFEGN